MGKAVALVTVPLLTRLLTPEEYGLADLANSLAAMLAMVVMFAGDIPAARLLGRDSSPESRRRVLGTYVWTTVLASCVVALVLIPFAGLITTDVWSAPDRILLALLAILLIPVSAVQASLVTTQRLESRPLAFAVLATVDLLAQTILAALFAALGFGATGMVTGFVLGSVIGLAVAAYQAWDLIATRPEVRLGLALLREGVPFLPASLGFVVANYGARFLLVGAEGQFGVGLFAVAVRLASGVTLVTYAFRMAWGPFGLALPDNERTARLFGRVMATYATVAALASIAIGAVAPEVVTVVSGHQYSGAATMLPGLLIGGAMAGGFYILLVAAGVSQRGRSVAVAAIAGASLQVLAIAILLPWQGLPAVGTGAVLGQAVALVILAAVIGDSVRGGRTSVLVLCLGGGAAVAVQFLNGNPTETLLLRLLIATVASVPAAWMTIRLIRTRILPKTAD